MNKIFDIVVFHYPCQDGLVSAWVTNSYHKQNNHPIELYPIQHGTPLNLLRLKNKKVLFCDYAPADEYLDTLEKECTSILILDHHITSANRIDKTYAYFDMTRSGAGIVWDYFFAKDRPEFINWVEDRDLWTWKYDESAKFYAGIQIVLSTLNYDDFGGMFNILDELIFIPGKPLYYIELGDLINRSIQNKASSIAYNHSKKGDRYIDENKEYNICIVNCPTDIISEVGSILTKEYNFDFAVLWRYNHPASEYIVSMRANNIADVSEIAKKFGGGGHKNAASFSTKINPITLFQTISNTSKSSS
jgi:oligoribonuclease NrnB/cAMP/cGMP phosphodiesterase (DHH superfamily)